MLKFPRLRQKKILVIGGTGFIGSHLVKHLIANDAKVTIIYRSKNKVGHNISQHSIDILNFKEVDKILKKEFDFIYQCAGSSQRLQNIDRNGKYQNNLIGTINILNSLKKNNIKSKIIFLGSRLEYGVSQYLPVDEKHPTCPLDSYSIEKLASSLYTLSYYHIYKIPCTIFRISNTYGPHPSFRFRQYNLINHFIDQAKNRKKLIIYGDGSQLRDYIFIGDLVNALLLASSNRNSDGEIFNVGYGKPISFLDFIKTIASQTDAKIIFKPWPKFYQQIETGNYYSNNRKIKEFLNWSPKTSYSTGIEKSLNSNLDI